MPITVETDHANLLHAQRNHSALARRWIHWIQSEFHIMHILHRPGLRNALADACSRAFDLAASDAKLLIGVKGPVEAVQEMAAKGHTKAKPSSAHLAAIAILAHIAEDPAATTEHAAALVGSLLDDSDMLSFIEASDDPTSPAEAEEGAPEPTDILDSLQLLQQDQQAAFDKVHNARVGHFGWRRTYIRLQKQFAHVPFSSNQVRDAVAECGVCQAHRPNVDAIQKAPPRSLPVPNTQGLISADTCKLPTDTLGNNYILLLINHTDKTVALHAMTTKEGPEVTKNLFVYCCRNGIPQKILTDPGAELKNVDTNALCKWLGMDHCFSIAKRPQGHGTEPTIGRAKRHLAILSSTERMRDQWSDPSILTAIELILNSNVNEETQQVPLTLKFGSLSAATMMDLLVEGRLTTPSSASKLVAMLDTNLKELREASNNIQQLTKLERRERSNNATIEHKYQRGDFVMWRSTAPFRLGGPLAPRLTGPFAVTSQTNNVVTATHLATGKERDLHHDRVTILCVSPEMAQELAAQGGEEHTITAITAHEGSLEKPRQDLRFLTHFADGDILWLPYAEVQRAEALDTYANCKACTRELLLGSIEDVAHRKKSYAQLTIQQLADAKVVGDLALHKRIWVSLHADALQPLARHTAKQVDSAGQDETVSESFLRGTIVKATAKRREIYLEDIELTLDWSAWRLRAYVQDHPLSEGQSEVRKEECEAFIATTNLPIIPSSTSSPPDFARPSQRTGLTKRTAQWTPAYQPGDQVYIRLRDNDWHQGTVQSCTRTTAIARCPHLESEQPGSDFVEVPISRCATRAPGKATNARDMFNDIAQHASNNAHGGRRTRAGNG